MLSTTHFSWHTLPTEMKLAVVDNLDHGDIKALARTDSETYHACVPALFQSVHLKSHRALQRFIDTVPKNYRRHIQHLDLCMLATSAGSFGAYDYDRVPSLADQGQSVVSLLTCCSRLEKLVLRMAGSLGPGILTAFPQIPHLKELAISNCFKDGDAPVSERLVVYIAASLPNLHTLALDQISRSTLHSAELDYAYPPIPRVMNDDDVPPHQLLGTHLNLPSLLRLPSLRKLSIKNTHLGDPEWESTVPPACRLEHLELGGCCHETELRNELAVQRILGVAGASVVDLALESALPPPPSSSSPPSSPASLSSFFSSESDLGSLSGSSLPYIPLHSQAARHPSSALLLGNLKILRTSPFFPIESLSETLSIFAGSPVESLSVECLEEDVLEVCQTLEDFLSFRVCREVFLPPPASSSPVLEKPERQQEQQGWGLKFFGGLKKIEVVVAQTQAWTECGGSLYRLKQEQMQYVAVRKLLGYCRDLGLVGTVRRVGRLEMGVGLGRAILGNDDGVRGSAEWSLDDEDCCWEPDVVSLL